MTIRLRCAGCQRKLKVPDDAQGRKIQCPACGTVFRHTAEAEAPPLAAPVREEPVGEIPLVAPVAPLPEEAPIAEAPAEESPLVDTLFTEMASHSLPDVAVPPESNPHDAPAPSPFVNLDLDEPSAPEVPAESDLEEFVDLEDVNAPEPVMLGDPETADPLASLEEEPVEVVDEVDEQEVITPSASERSKRPRLHHEEEAEDIEEEEEPEEKPRPAKAKKAGKGKLVGCLVAGLVVGLLGAAGIGYAVYRYFDEAPALPTMRRPVVPPQPMAPPPPPANPGPAAPVNPAAPAAAAGAALIPDSEWQWTSPPGSRCSFQMPGTPRPLKGNEDGAIRYQVARPRQGCQFEVSYHDLESGTAVPAEFLEKTVATLRERLTQSARGGSWNEQSIKVGVYPGRELVFQGQGGGATLTRVYLVEAGKLHRVYQLTVSGPRLYAGQPDVRKFFQSFMIASGDR